MITSTFYEGSLKRKISKLQDNEVETISDQIDNHDQFSSSYFSYADFSFLYKFYDSYKFNRLEKRFNIITKFDIGNCFNSIYTHSIGWATRSKRFVKETRNYHTFEKKFDEIMQSTKSQETNGIVIGPEFSRIFSEIIFQKIDLLIIKSVEKKLNLKYEVDYSLKRYIDDFFYLSEMRVIQKK